MWAFRKWMQSGRLEGKAAAEEDGPTKAALERAVLKHPRLRAPRGQNTLSHPSTKPFIFYTAPHHDDGSEGEGDGAVGAAAAAAAGPGGGGGAAPAAAGQ